MKGWTKASCGVIAALLLLGACSAKTSTKFGASPTSSASAAPSVAATKTSGPGATSTAAAKASAAPLAVSPSPTATFYPARVRATLTPKCVTPGGVMTLKVHLDKPKSAAAYIAYYADGGNGAKKPWGDEYGGNDSSITDDNGNWTSKWTVAPNAPVGPGRVDIYAAVAGVGNGFKSLPFTVGSLGSC